MSMEVWHVIPVNDLKEHEESETCWCKPAVEPVEHQGALRGTIVTHNSLDRREKYETGEIKPH